MSGGRSYSIYRGGSPPRKAFVSRPEQDYRRARRGAQSGPSRPLSGRIVGGASYHREMVNEYRPKVGDVLTLVPKAPGQVSVAEVVDNQGRAVLPAFTGDGERYPALDGWLLAGDLDLLANQGVLYRQGERGLERIDAITYP